MKRVAFIFAVFALIAAAFVVAGCSSHDLSDSVGNGTGNPPQTIDGVSCVVGTEPGCTCDKEGARIQCGKVTSVIDGYKTCGYGGQVCTAGKWSECELGAYAPGHDGYAQVSQPLLGPGVSCNNVCDPYCMTFTDSAGGLDAGLDAPIQYTDAGVVLRGNGNGSAVDGSTAPTPSDLAALSDAALPDSGYIYHVLSPGQTTTTPDPIAVFNPRPAGGDVYFLLDDTSSMGPQMQALGQALTLTSGGGCVTPTGADGGATGAPISPDGGIIDNLRCAFGQDVYFGIGRFEDYHKTPYVTSPAPPSPLPATPTNEPNLNLPYQHLLSMQANPTPADSTVNWVLNDAFQGGAGGNSLHSGGDVPEAMVPALWAAITGNSIFRSPSTSPYTWEMARSAWTSPMAPNSWIPAPDTANPAPCTGLSAPGYPCWRDLTTPIFLLISDAPPHDGPGGWYARPGNSTNNIDGQAAMPQAKTSGNPTWTNPTPSSSFNWAATPELDYDTTVDGFKARLYWGTVASAASQSSVSAGVNSITTVNDPSGHSGTTGTSSLRDCSTNDNTLTTACTTTTGYGSEEISLPDATQATVGAVNDCSGIAYTTATSNVPGLTQVSSTCTAANAFPTSASSTSTSASFNMKNTAGMNAPGGTTYATVAGSLPVGTRVDFTLTLVDDGQNSAVAAKLYINESTTAAPVTTSVDVATGAINYTTRTVTVSVYMKTASPLLTWGVLGQTASGTATFPFVTVTTAIYPPTATPACSGNVLDLEYTTAPRCCLCNTNFTYATSVTYPGGACTGYNGYTCPGAKTFTTGCAPPVAPSAPPPGTPAAAVGNCGDCVGYSSTAPGGVYVSGTTCQALTCSIPYSWNGGTNNVGGTGWAFDGPTTKCKPTAANDCSSPSATSNWCNSTYRLCQAATSPNYCRCNNIDGSNFTADPVPTGTVPAHGLTAIYYPVSPYTYNTGNTYPDYGGSTGWSAQPTARYDAVVGNGSASIAVPSTIPITSFTARWEGRITAPCTGAYTFYAYSDDGARMWVNDEEIVDNPVYQGYASHTGGWATGVSNVATPITLTAGQSYDFRYDYFQGSGGYAAAAYWTATCTVASVVGASQISIPTSVFTPTGYLGLNAGNPHGMCATTGSYTSCTPVTLGEGGSNAEAIYRFSVPANTRYYYHFGLLATDKTTLAATVSATNAKAFLYIKRRADAENGVAYGNQPVLDCNVNAGAWTLDSTASRGIVSELNGYIDGGTTGGDYYLVVDNSNTTQGAYNYILQANQFSDANYAAPNYYQMVSALKAAGAKVIGVESSGVACYESSKANFAQYQTKDFLDKIAIDTGTVNGNTGLPFTVSIRQEATSCNDPTVSATSALATAVNGAVSALANTLRQNITLRAVPHNGAPTPLPASADQFVASAVIDTTSASQNALVNSRCGGTFLGTTYTPTGTDPAFSTRGIYNECLPGTPIQFDVKFTVPGSVLPGATDQYFVIDVLVLGNGTSVLSRTPVVIKVPAAAYTSGDFVRDYDSNTTCQTGYSGVWRIFNWNSSAPLSAPPSNSQIDFYFGSAPTQAGLPAAGAAAEQHLAISTEYMTTACTGTGLQRSEVCQADVGAALTAAGISPKNEWLRMRAHLAASSDGTQAPILNNWGMTVDCLPSE